MLNINIRTNSAGLFLHHRCINLQNPILQPRIPFLFHLIIHHRLEHLRDSHEADAGFRPRNRRVDQISRHQHPRSRMDRDHHCRIFASLGFVDRDRVGEFQLLQLLKAVLHHLPLIKLHLHRLREAVDGPDDPRIPVENAFALIHRDSVAVADLPLDLVIVLDLHDLIAHAENRPAGLFLLLIRRRRVKLLLKLLI